MVEDNKKPHFLKRSGVFVFHPMDNEMELSPINYNTNIDVDSQWISA
jgi:hypothetical protein